LTVEGFLSLKWEDDGLPLIEPPWNSPVLADPTFLFPHETPEGVWVLFAHTAWGIRRYESNDAIVWLDQGMAVRNAMRPFCRPVAGGFLLFYERYRPFAMPLQILPRPPRWKSHLEYRASPDLRNWSSPETVLKADLAWMRDEKLGESLSNPCLVEVEGSWRLYFSASLAWIDDCGFCEPRYIGVAESDSFAGPFTPNPEPLIDPVIDPADDTLPGVLGAGAIKVIPLDDGYIGLQNKIYRDSSGHSRSALFLLRSDDGLSWRSARDEPLLAPSSGWRSSHVYACDCRQAHDGTWLLYYNARDGWSIGSGRERIGRIIGRE
jgi:hypothetical protein